MDHSDDSRHEFLACSQFQVFQESLHRREAERGEKRTPEAEEQTEHLGDGEDDLAVGNIEEKLLSHPLAPLLPPVGMTGGAESASFAGKA